MPQNTARIILWLFCFVVVYLDGQIVGTSLDSLNHVAVALIAGQNRNKWIEACLETWLFYFSNYLIVTDQDIFEYSRNSAAYNHTVNVFAGFESEETQLKEFIHHKNPFWKFRGVKAAQSKNPTHTIGWHLAQPRLKTQDCHFF